MPVDRSQLDLEHMTERLVASRDKPKRLYFIEQIGQIWAPGRWHSCFKLGNDRRRYRLHHAPTAESISAVASYGEDPSVYVRQAVARTLTMHSAASGAAFEVLLKLLSDADPVVRIVAANGLARLETARLKDTDQLAVHLTDSVWSVRWPVASVLANTRHHHMAWETLRNSIPKGLFFLDEWSEAANRFKSDLRNDPATLEKLRSYLSAHKRDGIFGSRLRWLMEDVTR